MRIGWVGLGALGYPCALALVRAGFHVSGYDVKDRWRDIQEGRVPLPKEAELGDLLAAGHRVHPSESVGEVVSRSEVVFCAVQTPHSPEYGGHTEMPAERRDFDYTALTGAVREIAREAMAQEREITIVVVSTALPGMFNRHLRPLRNEYATIVYNPFTIAMSETIPDFTNPEFVMIGADRPQDAEKLELVYRSLHSRPIQVMSVESAELLKVWYNVLISMKIVAANALMEVCDLTGADCDDITDALLLADKRLISGAYMRGGMGDGGACHPRDLIAMSWLAQHHDLSVDLMGFLAGAREDQSRRLRDLAWRQAELRDLPITLLGAAYKPECNLIAGSPALLLQEQLEIPSSPVTIVDPYVEGFDAKPPNDPRVFVITTKHDCWLEFDYPRDSVVIDPFGYIYDQPGVTVIRVGRKR